jgi:hypothetical protein
LVPTVAGFPKEQLGNTTGTDIWSSKHSARYATLVMKWSVASIPDLKVVMTAMVKVSAMS